MEEKKLLKKKILKKGEMKRLSVLGSKLLDQVLQGSKLSSVDEVELLNKENEMLEGGVEVGLLLQLHHRVKMLVVDVSVNPEQTLQDGFGHGHEVLGEGNSNLGGKKCLIIQLILHPGHQVVYVFGSGAFDRLLNVGAVSPVVLISWSSRHHRAARLSAELSDGAVKHVDLVEEIHGVDSDPLIEILSLGQHDSLPQVPAAQCRLSVLQQLILMGALWDVLLRLEGLG